ncbi:hypothetical protein M0Q97_03515 [Candidatus Dojkabacteria bacterium]|jgi:hypothetical protein|nr:hypothetical protein [Candidatus Dojkabacteria bacterium]
MLPEVYKENSIENFHLINYDEVNIIDFLKIDNRLYGRFDLIINKYFRGNIGFLPILYAFNNITDPIEINIGRIIKIPDIDSIEKQLKINKILEDDVVPGIVSDMNNFNVNSKIKIKNNSSKTTALPKLNITLTKVKYDATTGDLTL